MATANVVYRFCALDQKGFKVALKDNEKKNPLDAIGRGDGQRNKVGTAAIRRRFVCHRLATYKRATKPALGC